MKHTRKTRSPSIFVFLPWWLTASGAVVVWFWFTVILPGFHFQASYSNPLVGVLDQMLHLHFMLYIAWTIAAALLALAGQSYWRSAQRSDLLRNRRTVDQIREMSWQDFELLVGQAYRKLGWKVTETGLGGADGGIDLIISKGKETHIVQCKRYTNTSIGAPIVREIYGLMMHHGATGAKVVCVGKFTKAAIEFAEGKPIDLVGAEELAEMIKIARAR